MANLFETLLPTRAQDIVGIFTQDFTQIFMLARPIKAVVKEESKLMEHPVETGVITTDHVIILPVEIELSMILNSLDYPSVYQTIRQNYLSKTLLIVQTKTAVYTNQIIASMPHQEDPEQYDMIKLALKLKQVQFVTAAYGVVPRRAANSTNVNRGVQTPATPTSILSGTGNTIGLPK